LVECPLFSSRLIAALVDQLSFRKRFSMTIYSISLITGRIYIAKRLQYSSRIFFSRIVISPIIYLETLIRPRSSTTFSAQLTACFCDLDGASFQNRARCFVCWLYVTKLGLMACSSAREDSLSPARRHGVFGYTTILLAQ
jgi:hypothetical protein